MAILSINVKKTEIANFNTVKHKAGPDEYTLCPHQMLF